MSTCPTSLVLASQEMGLGKSMGASLCSLGCPSDCRGSTHVVLSWAPSNGDHCPASRCPWRETHIGIGRHQVGREPGWLFVRMPLHIEDTIALSLLELRLRHQPASWDAVHGPAS